ncbi:hypothetical protein P3W45_001599 [Vairimorpha bombi]|jgi:hypothetical protein
MTTTTFKNLRALIQLFSVLLILINIPLPFILFFNSDIVTIEVDHLEMGYLSLTLMYKTVIICNITLGMFASCGMNSKIKLYMRIYLLVTFVYLMFFIACILYVKNSYTKRLITTFVERSNSSVPLRCIMENLLMCTMGSSCENALRKSSGHLVKYFMWVSLSSLVLHTLSFIFIRITVNIEINKQPIKPPRFATVTRAGMDTQSLRHKRVLEVENAVVV